MFFFGGQPWLHRLGRAQPSNSMRIHVGGLSPTVTPAELKARLSKFGPVHGEPELFRREQLDAACFGYVETGFTAEQLARCQSAYGSCLWRGGMIRISEAKANFLTVLSSEQADRRKQEAARAGRALGLPSRAPPATAVEAKRRHGWTIGPSGQPMPVVRIRHPRTFRVSKPDLTALAARYTRIDDSFPLPPPRGTDGSAVLTPRPGEPAVFEHADDDFGELGSSCRAFLPEREAHSSLAFRAYLFPSPPAPPAPPIGLPTVT